MVKSINALRLKREPLEKTFVEQWELMNKDQGILKFILDRSHSNRGDYYPTETEQEVAVAIIQWLGSPVGQGFLACVNENA